LIWFYDDDESFKAFDTGILTVETNLADGNLNNGFGEEELLNENNISYKLVEKTEEQFVVSISNNSDTMNVFSGKNVVVNGFTLDTTYNLDIFDKIVFPGCSYPMTFEYNWSASDDFKGTNGISKIENVTFNFEVRPNDDYFQEYTTSQMTITY
jgi:archaellum component FlaF (FlaF/FlaG flagellin family)